MDPASDKRKTQLDLRALGEFDPFSQTAALRDRHVEHDRASGNRSVRDRGAVNTAATKRARTPSPNAVDPATGLKLLKLPESLRSRGKGSKSVKHESPWKSCEKNYELRLGVGDRVTVAERKDPLSGVVTVKSLSAHNAEKKLRTLQRIQHENFVSILEIFSSEESLHIIFEHMPISLGHFAGILKYSNELQLASILGQILNGLAYLAAEGLEHGSLSSSNILVNMEGDVKLANQECCHIRSSGNTEPRDIRALSFITMELMQKYVKDGGAVGVDDLRRWRSDSKAVGFLSETTSATSVDRLMNGKVSAIRMHDCLKCGLGGQKPKNRHK